VKVVEEFDVHIAKCPAEMDTVDYMVRAVLHRAWDAGRSAKNGYHELDGKAVRNLYASDCRDDIESFDSVVGQVLPKIYAGPLLAKIPTELQAFLGDLCRQRYDLFQELVAALEDVRAVNHDKRKQLHHAYEAWKRSRRKSPNGKVPNPKKVPVFAIPAGVRRLPQDAEILSVLEDGCLQWTSPELVTLGRTRQVSWEVDEVYTDENGNDAFRPVLETISVPDDDRYSPIYVLAA
jgi:hypothetical protein